MGARPICNVIALFLLGFSIPTANNQAFAQSSSSEIVDLLREETANAISFQEKIAFMSPNGDEIVPSPGTYRVELVSPSTLRLVPFEKKESFLIKAESRRHDEDIGVPVALVVIDDEYLFHVVLLLPDQKGLEAIGSSSRGRHRGSPELLTPAQIRDAFNRKKAGARAPDSPPPTQNP